MPKPKLLLIPAILLILFGCASPPIATSLSSIAENPTEYKNKSVEITAHVLDNPRPTGNVYRTWNFTVGSPSERILVTESGYNPTTINKAYQLVREAQKEGEPVTIIGRLRVGPYRSLKSGTEIDLEGVRYKGTEIDTDQGPFVGSYYYPYPYYLYPRPYYWDYGFYPYGFGYFGSFGDYDGYGGFGFNNGGEEGDED